MKRSIRRHHRIRIKARVKKMIRHCWHDSKALSEDEKFVGRQSSHHHSCGMCGNQRKWIGDTLQELKDKQFVKEELEECEALLRSFYL